MPPDNAESLSDPFAPSESEEPVPDSSPLQVSANTLLESGIPPARMRGASGREASLGEVGFDLDLALEGGVQRMEAALGNVVRTEANLSLLQRGLKHLAAGAQAAREANTELTHELEELRSHLSRSHEEQHALRFRMTQLEQLLDVIRHESSNEREFLIEQQDRFLVEILNDHDRQVSELRQHLRESNQSKADAEKIEELIAQRDQARDYATRCERERDLAWQELATINAVPTERVERSPSGATAIGAVNLRSVAMSASSSVLSASSAAPETVRSSQRSSPTGYSLSGDDVSE